MATTKKKRSTTRKKKTTRSSAGGTRRAGRSTAFKGSNPDAKVLLVVESPAKARTIQKYLGKDYEVIASKGHVKDLPKRGGVDEENDFAETYVLIEEKGKKEFADYLARRAREVERILLATDPDREGEAIAWHIAEIAKEANPDVEVQRVLFHEITKKGVQAGLAEPRPLDRRLYEAQRTRRVLDRIGGYPLSSLLWRKLVFGLSAGRVQTPALRILVERQREIEAFEPRDYWLVLARLRAEQRGGAFDALLTEVDGEKLEKVASRPAATSAETAERWVEELKAAAWQVARVQKREQKRRAPAPYTTSKLQQDAASRLGMTPKRTMRIAQQLYEGVQLGKGRGAETVGLITYMRTDSTRISPDAVEAVRGLIAERFGQAYLPQKPNVFRAKKKALVQDAHEAIRPTRLDLPPEAVRPYLKDEQFRLYKLVWDRFVACQMAPAVYDQTQVEIEARGATHRFGLRVSGSVLRFPGWKAVYGAEARPLAGEEQGEEAEQEGTLQQGELPPLEPGESLRLVVPPGVRAEHKRTEPPSQYTEASLVKKLEEEGIGRPSTYAEIIAKVQARDYVQKKGGRLVPTDLGRLVVDRLVEHHFDLADVGFTRKLEEALDAVEAGRAERVEVLRPFHEKLQKRIEEVLGEKGKWWPEPEPLEERCPECGEPLVKRWGRNGPFVGCSGFPACKYTRNLQPAEGGGDEEGSGERPATPAPEPTDYECPKCGAPMLKRWGRNGWFLGCSRFPKCRSTMPMPLGIACPKCKEGQLVEQRTRNRRTFYGCNRWNAEPPCDFKLWQRPVDEPCPRCGAPFLVQAGGKKKPVLRCVTEGCGFERPATPEDPQGETPAASGEASPTASTAS